MHSKGNNGLSGFNFGPSQFQNLLFLAGYDPSQPPGTAPCRTDSGCVLPYLGRIRDGQCPGPARSPLFSRLTCIAVNSIVLLTNGISFALQAVVLLVIGAWADYGKWRYASVSCLPSRNFSDSSLTGRTSLFSSLFWPWASPSPGSESTIRSNGVQGLPCTSLAVRCRLSFKRTNPANVLLVAVIAYQVRATLHRF